MTTNFSKIKHNSVRNCIFEFFYYKELLIIANLDKQSRNILKRYQKDFIKYAHILYRLRNKNIKSIEELSKEQQLFDEVYENDQIFQNVFDFLVNKDKYKFEFIQLIKGNEKEIKKLTFITMLDGLIKNKEIKELSAIDIGMLREDERDIYYHKLIKLIQLNKSITHIYLNDNKLGSNFENIKYLVEGLKFNQSLTHLGLSTNSIGQQGMKELIKCSFQNLIYLNLFKNAIGAQGIIHLSECFLPKLIRLDLSYNSLGDEGIHNLIKCYFPILCNLDLSRNNITSEGMDNLNKCSFPNLNRLWLSQNSIKDHGIYCLKKCSFPDLINLDLSSNYFENKKYAEFQIRQTFQKLIDFII